MAQVFDADVRTRVLSHMNDDHADDNVLIARAFGPSTEVVAATMTGFDADGGDWIARSPAGEDLVIRVPWPSGSISERPQVRREIVALYDEACRRLGVPPRPHA